jgi:metacaspase-1
MSSKAVLFGIDYLKSNAPLRGCANDVKNMAKYLKNDLDYHNVKIYTEQDTPDKVTGYSIVRILYKLAMESKVKNYKNVLIHFSGHGVSVADRNNDEVDGKDEAICPVDYELCGVITDDLIKKILRYFNPNTKVTCVFDCCHSGTIGDLKYKLTDKNKVVISNKDANCKSNIVMISGCRDDQTSADAYNVSGKKQFSGAMTSCLLECIKYRRVVNGVVNAVTLVNDVRSLLKQKGFSQIPIITSSKEITGDTILF